MSSISLGSGDHQLIDNQSGITISAGDGNNTITESGTNDLISLGNGNNIIKAIAGGNTVVTGTGDQTINLNHGNNSVTVGGNAGGATDMTTILAGTGATGHNVVVTGDGNMTVVAGGYSNSVTVGTGTTLVKLAGVVGANAAATADTVVLGNGNNTLYIGGNGNLIQTGSGTDTIYANYNGASYNDRFVLDAAGGTQTLFGFTLTNGDVLDLTHILADAGVASDLSNLGDFVGVATQIDATYPQFTDTVLTVRGSGGTDTITLANTGGGIGLSDLVSHGSLALPTPV